MKDNRYLILLFILSISTNLINSQPDSLFLNPVEKEDQGWTLNEEIGLYVNQVSFTNWNAGGANSISAIFNGKAEANFKNDKFF